MRLYSGMSRNFIDDTVRNQIAGKLEDAFFRHFRYRPSPGEVNCWRNSLRAVTAFYEQLVVYETVLAWARKGFHDRRPTVIVVRGGPGTGG